MKRLQPWLLPAALIAAGIILMAAGIHRPVTLVIDGIPQTMGTRAFRVETILREAGISPQPLDRVSPDLNDWVGWNERVVIERAHQFQVWLTPGGLSQPFSSAERIPENVLLQAGLRLYPGDRLAVNGEFVPVGKILPAQPSYVVQVLRASPFTLVENDRSRILFSTAASIAGALWEAGVKYSSIDALDPGPEAVLVPALTVSLRRAAPASVQSAGSTTQAMTAAGQVGEALAQAGVALQGLDTSTPPEDQPLPADRTLRVARVREEIILQQTSLPYQTETVQDPDTDIDQHRVIQAGQTGLKVTRERVRYEDGVEVARQPEGEWVAREPQTEKIGWGTRVAIHTLDTPDGPIEYWRAVDVYATSYSPCGLGDPATTKCYSGTSLGLPVQRGVIAVTKTWYRQFAGMQVYVPGYGKAVIADIGAGIPGRRWIDLGFTDADLELWHQNVTMYFLTPVPANVPLEMP